MAPNLTRSKVPDKKILTLTKDKNNPNKRWEEKEIQDIYKELKTPATEPRIFLIPPSEKPKPYEELALDEDCKRILTRDYHFPKCLFDKTWVESNGFAGLRQYSLPNPKPECITISWLRVLVKIVKNPSPPYVDNYYWHEMTFLIHDSDSDQKVPTVFCCDIDQRFRDKMVADLNSDFVKKPLDWKDIHAVLFRQIASEVDVAVWACSKAVRGLEKTRPDSNRSLRSKIEFHQYHDLLRHAIHISETLEAACQNLKEWTTSYQALAGPDGPPDDDDNHHDMLCSLQMMQSLAKRSDSNEERLRNEINLAFNVVNQQDAKAVRIISVVTLLFLPATFVSTLFSMSFFSFQPPYDHKWGVSPKIWIYFAVTVPLTVATVVVWFQLSRILNLLHDLREWFYKLELWKWFGGKKKMVSLFGWRGLSM